MRVLSGQARGAWRRAVSVRTGAALEDGSQPCSGPRVGALVYVSSFVPPGIFRCSAEPSGSQ